MNFEEYLNDRTQNESVKRVYDARIEEDCQNLNEEQK